MTMRLLAVALLTVCLAPSSSLQAASDDRYPMRWRAFVDHDSRTAFRYPYEFQTPDQYAARFRRPGSGGGGMIQIEGVGGELSPEQVAELVRQARAKAAADADMWHVATVADDLPAGTAADDLGAVLQHLSEDRLSQFTDYDYYAASDRRPHADPEWAPAGVTAVLGTGAEHCGILLAHEDRFAAIIASGGLEDHRNQAIFDTFEVLNRGGSREPWMTWREMQTTTERSVISHLGKPVSVRARSDGAVDWRQAWEAETANYHVTCTVSPQKTYYFAMLMEALYQEYAKVFKPEVFPPFKMEIHVLDTADSFARMANAKGFGSVAGALGFFSPGQLCIYAYDRPPRGMSMGVDKTLAHEASHQFLHVTCNGSRHVPTWINEGLAVYFESGVFKNGQYKWRPPTTRISQLKAYYNQTGGTVQPLDQYLDHYGHIPAIAYGEVYAMTHFWIFGVKAGRDRNGEPTPSGRERFVSYWNALKAGENGTEAFERIFLEDMIAANGGKGAAIEKWEEMMQLYVNKSYPLKRPRD